MSQNLTIGKGVLSVQLPDGSWRKIADILSGTIEFDPQEEKQRLDADRVKFTVQWPEPVPPAITARERYFLNQWDPGWQRAARDPGRDAIGNRHDRRRAKRKPRTI